MKSNLDKFFKVSDSLSKNGVDFQIDDKTSFRLRHFSPTNPRVRAALATHYKPFTRQIEMGTLDQGTQQEIKIKLFTDICLVEWKGVEIDGKEAECTPDNAMRLFKDLTPLFDALWNHANDFNNYREDLGNS